MTERYVQGFIKGAEAHGVDADTAVELLKQAAKVPLKALSYRALTKSDIPSAQGFRNLSELAKTYRNEGAKDLAKLFKTHGFSAVDFLGEDASPRALAEFNSVLRHIGVMRKAPAMPAHPRAGTGMWEIRYNSPFSAGPVYVRRVPKTPVPPKRLP